MGFASTRFKSSTKNSISNRVSKLISYFSLAINLLCILENSFQYELCLKSLLGRMDILDEISELLEDLLKDVYLLKRAGGYFFLQIVKEVYLFAF